MTALASAEAGDGPGRGAGWTVPTSTAARRSPPRNELPCGSWVPTCCAVTDTATMNRSGTRSGGSAAAGRGEGVAAVAAVRLRHHERAAAAAIGLVLVHSGQLGTAWWQWTDAEWISLIGTSSEEFRRA